MVAFDVRLASFQIRSLLHVCGQALLAQHKGSAQLESQARAVEYGQIFQYGELRTQLLEHMPPLDAAAYARSAAAAGTLNSAPAALVRVTQPFQYSLKGWAGLKAMVCIWFACTLMSCCLLCLLLPLKKLECNLLVTARCIFGREPHLFWFSHWQDFGTSP